MDLLLLIIITVASIIIFSLWQSRRDSRHDADMARSQFNELSYEVARKAEEQRATARRRYVTKALKRHVLERDEHTCQICGISKGLLDDMLPGLGDFLLLEIDHIVPVAKGGSGDDEGNLQTLCWRCNRKKGKNRTNEQVKEMIDYGVDGFDAR